MQHLEKVNTLKGWGDQEREALEHVHDKKYLDHILASALEGLRQWDGDIAMSVGSLRAARLAAGDPSQDQARLLRHASAGASCRAMGFRFFNNVAVGAAAALESPDIVLRKSRPRARNTATATPLVVPRREKTTPNGVAS